MATMAWAVVMVAMAVAMDVAMVAQAVVLAGAMAFMDVVAAAHLGVEDTAHMGSTEKLPKKLNHLVHVASGICLHDSSYE